MVWPSKDWTSGICPDIRFGTGTSQRTGALQAEPVLTRGSAWLTGHSRVCRIARRPTFKMLKRTAKPDFQKNCPCTSIRLDMPPAFWLLGSAPAPARLLVLLGCYSFCDSARKRAECYKMRILGTRINTSDFALLCIGAGCCEVLRMD